MIRPKMMEFDFQIRTKNTWYMIWSSTLENYRTWMDAKSSLSNLIFTTWFFKNQVQINRGKKVFENKRKTKFVFDMAMATICSSNFKEWWPGMINQKRHIYLVLMLPRTSSSFWQEKIFVKKLFSKVGRDLSPYSKLCMFVAVIMCHGW